MNIKTIIYSILCSQILLLTACIDLRPWEYRPKKDTTPEFQDARGGGVSPCGASYILNVKEGHGYLRKHGLPVEIEGNFICENGKPTLPKDCEGKEMRSVAELEAYWKKYQLPRGLIHFDCSSGVPKVRPQSIKFWQSVEIETPSCKDERGRPKPCV